MTGPLIIKRPEPDLTVRTYLVERREHIADMLEGPGLYFRTRDRGGLIVFDRHGLSMATYERGDWVSIKDMTKYD